MQQGADIGKSLDGNCETAYMIEFCRPDNIDAMLACQRGYSLPCIATYPLLRDSKACDMQHDHPYTTHIAADNSYGELHLSYSTTGYSRASQQQSRHADPPIGCIV